MLKNRVFCSRYFSGYLMTLSVPSFGDHIASNERMNNDENVFLRTQS
jgi:hypothetical protein